MDAATQNAYKAALEWYIDQGVNELLLAQPIDRLALRDVDDFSTFDVSKTGIQAPLKNSLVEMMPYGFLGASEAYSDAVRRAREAKDLQELRKAIIEFEGISIKKTASNMVFSDGNPKARVMLVGDAPGTDEDRLGTPFSGSNGDLLDRMLRCINIDRQSDDIKKSVYISYVLNWRPPGNRAPNNAEIELSLPFIERHIQLAEPKLLILCGAVAAQALLGRSEGISRLRGRVHDYKVLTNDLYIEGNIIPAFVTYSPYYLIHTPSQKRAAWSDMLDIAQKIALFT